MSAAYINRAVAALRPLFPEGFTVEHWQGSSSTVLVAYKPTGALAVIALDQPGPRTARIADESPKKWAETAARKFGQQSRLLHYTEAARTANVPAADITKHLIRECYPCRRGEHAAGPLDDWTTKHPPQSVKKCLCPCHATQGCSA